MKTPVVSEIYPHKDGVPHSKRHCPGKRKRSTFSLDSIKGIVGGGVCPCFTDKCACSQKYFQQFNLDNRTFVEGKYFKHIFNLIQMYFWNWLTAT